MLIVLASVAAIIGDILGIIGRLAQTALVPVGLQTAAGTEMLSAERVLDVLDTTINTAGFVLVSVSFTCFGILMLPGFSRPIGWIAIVAGVFTLLGQIRRWPHCSWWPTSPTSPGMSESVADSGRPPAGTRHRTALPAASRADWWHRPSLDRFLRRPSGGTMI